MALITRDAVLNATDLRRELVPVPEWGGEVYVRELTGLERDRWETEQAKIGRTLDEAPTYKADARLPQRNIRASLVALACCDETGKAIFRPEDAAELGKRSAAVLDRLFDVAARLAGITKEVQAEIAGESLAPDAD